MAEASLNRGYCQRYVRRGKYYFCVSPLIVAVINPHLYARHRHDSAKKPEAPTKKPGMTGLATQYPAFKAPLNSVNGQTMYYRLLSVRSTGELAIHRINFYTFAAGNIFWHLNNQPRRKGCGLCSRRSGGAFNRGVSLNN